MANIYQENPLWLKLTATLIQEVFSGKVSDFLQCGTLVLPESLQTQLEQQLQRLTSPEIAIMTLLAQEAAPIHWSQLVKLTNLPTSQLLNGMQSLKMRLFLKTKETNNVTFFSLSSVLKEYLKSRDFSESN